MGTIKLVKRQGPPRLEFHVGYGKKEILRLSVDMPDHEPASIAEALAKGLAQLRVPPVGVPAKT